jgi:hypothetical protein
MESNIVSPQNKTLDDDHAFQGQVLWLPAKSELIKDAVKRAHGKGPVEGGIYDHPVVVVSRPLGDSREVHFYVVSTSPMKRMYGLLTCRRLHLCKAKRSNSCTIKPTSSKRVDGRGIFLWRRHPIIPTLSPRRQRSDFQPLNLRTEQHCDGTRTSTSEMCTKSTRMSCGHTPTPNHQTPNCTGLRGSP